MNALKTDEEREWLKAVLHHPTFQVAVQLVQQNHLPAAGIDSKIAAIPGISGLEMLGLQEMRNAGVFLAFAKFAELAYIKPPAKLDPANDPRGASASLQHLAVEGGFEA